MAMDICETRLWGDDDDGDDKYDDNDDDDDDDDDAGLLRTCLAGK